MFRRLAIVGLIVLAHAGISYGQTTNTISPQSYGVQVGAGKSAAVRAANHTAMNACLSAAQSSGKTVLLPAATIEIDVPNKGSAASSTFKVNRNLQVIGSDPRLSKIKFGPESPTYNYSGFYVYPNTFVLFKNLIIEGPTYAGPNGENNRQTYAILQTGQSGQRYDTPGELKLHNVDVAGEWYTSIQGAHGDALLEFIDCDITGYTQCVAWSAIYNFGKRVHAKNTYFHDAGLPGKGHLIYLSPVVSFNIDNCRFGGNYRYAIHHYGSGTLLPRYAILQNSIVENTCKDGIETTNKGITQILNTVFNNRGRGVAFKGDTVIQGCTFNPGSGVTTYDNHSGVRISISQSKFNSAGIVTSTWDNCVWNISDCDFNGVNSPTAIGNGSPGSQYYIDNCRFNGSWNRGVFVSAGSYFVTNCKFQGSYVEGAVVYEDPKLIGPLLDVKTSQFQQTGRSLWARSGLSGKVTGSGNTFSARQPEGKLGLFQLLQLGSLASPTSLSSASTIAPHFNYNRYTVTGTAQINNIKVGGSDLIDSMSAGQITLVSSGWSLSNTGNIRPRTTARRAVGALVVLTHDPATGLWKE